MRSSFTHRLALAAIILASAGNAQNPLLGSWNASCPIEKTSESWGNACDLCPASFDKSSKEVHIQDFEMRFEAKSLMVRTETDVKTTFYTWDDLMRILEFKYDGRRYVFKVMVSNSTATLVLKEAEGMLVLLEKKR